MSDQMDRDKARLILLIGEFMAAKREGNAAAIRETTAALRIFGEKTVFSSLGAKATATIVAASFQTMEEALKRMTDIADELSPLRQTFQAAAELADEGKAGLFFVRTASTLVQVDSLLHSVLDVAESFENDIAAVHDDFDLEKLRALIGKISSTGQALREKLEAIGT